MEGEKRFSGFLVGIQNIDNSFKQKQEKNE